MKNLFRATVLLLGTISLVGCSYFDKKEDVDLSGTPPKVEKIDLTNKGQDQDADMAMSDKSVETTPLQAAQPVADARKAIEQSTDGSVEVYPLDGAAPQGSGAPVNITANTGGDARDVSTVNAVPVDPMDGLNNIPAVYSGDPSVEVFPLDGPVPPQAVRTVAPVTGMGGSTVISSNGNISTIYFDRSSAKLTGDGEATVAEVAAKGGQGVTVDGYASTESKIADPVKRKIANLKISMERAFTVARALIDKGVPPEAVTTTAHGENNPAATDAESRRVEIRRL